MHLTYFETEHQPISIDSEWIRIESNEEKKIELYDEYSRDIPILDQNKMVWQQVTFYFPIEKSQSIQ